MPAFCCWWVADVVLPVEPMLMLDSYSLEGIKYSRDHGRGPVWLTGWRQQAVGQMGTRIQGRSRNASDGRCATDLA